MAAVLAHHPCEPPRGAKNLRFAAGNGGIGTVRRPVTASTAKQKQHRFGLLLEAA